MSTKADEENMDVADMHRTCRRLLSLLPPPPDAAVREAVESIEKLNAVPGSARFEELQSNSRTVVRKLLEVTKEVQELRRAVQAPRLTGEQVEAVKWAKRFIVEHGGQASAWVDERRSQGESEDMDRDMENGLAKLRAAFPGAFEGEATDKSGFECLVGMTFTKSEDAEDE